ncbi:MAG: hypothetical protein JHD16_07645 [Solirubrobacteraceae bacterium]|nr:hypothetical protein [Solirubrobacteraceae bacterium]
MAAPSADFDLDLERDVDLIGRAPHVWYRRAGLGVMAVFVGAALAGLFGQSPQSRTASGEAAELRIRMPERIRGGLMWAARIEVEARQRIVAPQLVLGSGFVKGMQLNTIAPAPTSETTRAPGPAGLAPLAWTYPTLEAGDTLTVYLQLQVDATTVGREDVSISVEGDGIDPVRSPATMTVLP